MARQYRISYIPKVDERLDRTQLESKKSIEEVQAERLAFYGFHYGGHVLTSEQLNLRRNVAGALERDNPGIASDQIIDARLTDELVKIVLTRDENETYMGLPWQPSLLQPNKGLRRAENYVKGAASILGANRMIEDRLATIYGPVRRGPDIRRFVANRFVGALSLAQYGALVGNPLFVANGITPLTPRGAAAILLADAPLEVLQTLNNIPLLRNVRDLERLIEVRQIEHRISGEVLSVGVYDPRRLQGFFDDLGNVAPEGQGLQQRLNNLFLQDSMWPIHEHPEGQALLAELEHRVNTIPITAAHLIDNSVNPPRQRSQLQARMFAIDEELQVICAQDFDRARQSSTAITETLNTFNDFGRDINKHMSQLGTLYAEAEQICIQMAPILVALNTAQGQNNNQLQTRQQNLAQRQTEVVRLITESENKIKDSARELYTFLFNQNNSTYINANLQTFFNDITALMPSQPSQLNGANQNFGSGFANYVRNWTQSPQGRQLLDSEFNRLRPNFDSGNYGLEPFQVLYLLRRSSEIRRGLNTEEAARYAMLYANVKVNEVKSVNHFREVNRSVSEYLEAGGLRQTWRVAVAKLNTIQDYVGLHPFNIKSLTEAHAIEQIAGVGKFDCFGKLNKYSNLNDVMKVLHDNPNIGLPELQEFYLRLEALMQEYKQNRRIAFHDYDLTDLIRTMKLIHMEMSGREFIKTVRNPLNDEETNMLNDRLFLKRLREKREADARMEDSLREEVQAPDALWKKCLEKEYLKNGIHEEIKDVQQSAESNSKEIADLQSQIGKIDAAVARLSPTDPVQFSKRRRLETKKSRLQRRLSHLELLSDEFEAKLDESQDLVQQMEETMKYAEEHDLSRAEARKLYRERGLSTVMDKMAMNYRLRRWGRKAKAAWRRGFEKDKGIFRGPRAQKVYGFGKRAAKVSALTLTSPLWGPFWLGYKGLVGSEAGKKGEKGSWRGVKGYGKDVLGSFWRTFHTPARKRYEAAGGNAQK